MLFESSQQRTGRAVTGVEIIGRKWHLYDYGDATPGVQDSRISDIFQGVINERNQCLSIHMADGLELSSKEGARRQRRRVCSNALER